MTNIHGGSAMVRSASSLILASMVFALTIVGSPVSRAAAQTCVSPPSGMVSWYTMDGFLNDRLGANNPASVNNVSFVTGSVGQGVTLGSGGFIDIPDSPGLQLQRITVDAWAKPNGPG